MKASDLREMSLEELQGQLENMLDEYANLRIQKATHQLSNPKKLTEVRRDVARTKTLIHERTLGINNSKKS